LKETSCAPRFENRATKSGESTTTSRLEVAERGAIGREEIAGVAVAPFGVVAEDEATGAPALVFDDAELEVFGV